MEAWIGHEAAVRYYALIGSFGLVAVWEALAPHPGRTASVAGRWGINVGLALLLSVVVSLVFPLLAVGVALAAERASFGLLNVVRVPGWLAFVVAFVAIDAGRYAMHALLHRVPLLWRLHRVHHSDVAFDCSTALRFHPLEGLVTVSAQLALVAALGAPAAAVLAYEVVTAFVSLFSHGNLRLPAAVDRALRHAIVTPGMHRIHHSARLAESGTNYGSVLTCWDRLLRTYRAAPLGDEDAMPIGLADVRDARARDLRWLLAAPFLRNRASGGATPAPR